jgi:hypothetical protein
MALIPVRSNRLEASWEGPATIVEVKDPVNYIIELPDRRKSRRLYHANLLKAFREKPVIVAGIALEGLPTPPPPPFE